jgi:hypothetical protein
VTARDRARVEKPEPPEPLTGLARAELRATAGIGDYGAYYKGLLRVDGQPTWRQPLTPRNGSITLSPFVTLAART